jgi:glycosyltransferase involved in cell wall biosynthesis
MPTLTVLTGQLRARVPGGTGRYTEQLTHALRASAPDGWQVRTVSLPPQLATALWDARVPYWPGGDVVHAPTPLAPPRVPRGKRLTVTVHDTVPWTHPETLTARGAAWHRRAIERAAAIADVICPTAVVATELSVHVPAARTTVIGHGYTPELRKPGYTSIELPEEYVLYLGTLEPRKGIDTLAAANLSLPLVMVGQRGWGAVDVPPGARYLGTLADIELAAVLQCASALILPSRAEGYGLPLLEAMAIGVPIAYSDIPALREVAHGHGHRFPVGDPVALSAAVSAALASSAAEIAAARTDALGRTWRAAAEQYWQLIE